MNMYQLYKLYKPDLSKVTKEAIGKIFIDHKDELLKLFQSTITPRYLYWDKLRFKSLPAWIKPEEFWLITKIIRDSQAEKTVIRDENGNFFSWLKLPGLEAFLHRIDMQLGGRPLAYGKDVDEKKKALFVAQGVLEEAIASSQLEGANTTRKVAKSMIREGRKPNTRSEQMIMNNYEIMRDIENRYKNQPLDENLLLELHRAITHHTDVPESDQGRFRKDSDEIVVHDRSTGTVYHKPPNELFLKKEIPRFIAFANSDEPFIHPILKAIMIHFWIGYLHPFTDGNGRLGRLLFYWYLLKNDYWAFAYLPISKIIKRAPALYKMAYVHSEQDDSDLTYFIDYHINRIELATEDFSKYCARVSIENRNMNKLMKSKYNFNDRQIQTLQYLNNDPEQYTSIRAHQNVNQVSRMTAYNDIKALEKLEFLRHEKKGRRVYYFGTSKIKELFN